MDGLHILDVMIPYLFIHFDGVSFNTQQSFKVVPQERAVISLNHLSFLGPSGMQLWGMSIYFSSVFLG